MWLLEPAKPVRVYSQGAYGYMQPINGSHDMMFTTVTMDNGVVVMIGGGWNFPESYPNYCSTWIEITGTDGALVLDDTQRDNWLNTEKTGQVFPMSTMPGEQVDHVFAGGMGPETIHFLEACIQNKPVMVTPESARMVMETYTAADLSADRNEPVDLPLTNETIAAIADLKAQYRAGDNPAMQDMRTQAADIGLAIIGGGRVGLFRGEVANRHPAVKWIGLAEKNPNRAGEVAPRVGADFVTQSHVELLKRPEVTCAIIATDEHLHVDPIMAAVERGIPLLIEKPLATDLAQSAKVLKAIKDAKIDAVVGYTQRFRRKWLAGKEKVRTGALGDVTLVTSRAFMNRLVAIDNYKRTDDPKTISPMVISGTHALDMCMWYLEKKTPVECYARSIDKVLGPLYQGIDATAGMIMMSDGSIYHLNISWALPVTWPGAVYSLEVGITGTDGVLTIDDTHRDMVLAVCKPQGEGYAPDQTPAGRFPRQLSARRHGARRIARPDGGRDRVMAQPRRARPADAGRDRRRGAQQPDADQGAGPVGQAQAAGEVAARSGRGEAGGVATTAHTSGRRKAIQRIRSRETEHWPLTRTNRRQRITNANGVHAVLRHEAA